MSLPTTSAEALELATRLSGNPHNAREVEKLKALALFAKDKELSTSAVLSWEAGWEARNPAKELLAAGSVPVKPWSRAAANRARKARKAEKSA